MDIAKWVPLAGLVVWVFGAGAFMVGDTQEITWGTLTAVAFATGSCYLIGLSMGRRLHE